MGCSEATERIDGSAPWSLRFAQLDETVLGGRALRGSREQSDRLRVISLLRVPRRVPRVAPGGVLQAASHKDVKRWTEGVGSIGPSTSMLNGTGRNADHPTNAAMTVAASALRRSVVVTLPCELAFGSAWSGAAELRHHGGLWNRARTSGGIVARTSGKAALTTSAMAAYSKSWKP